MSSPPTPNPLRLLVFGPFAFDEASGELRKHGVRLRLQGQPLQILVGLIRQPGRVVTREEFHQQLWKANTFADFDHGLNAAMNRLRQVLGDSAEQPLYIETLPGRGYRFIGPVQAASPNPVLEMVPAPAAREIETVSLLPALGEAQIPTEVLAGASSKRTSPAADVSRRSILLWATTARPLLWPILAALALITLATVHLREKASELPVMRFTISPPEQTAFQFTGVMQGSPALSPDGRRLVFKAGAEGHSQLWFRPLDQVAAQPLAGTEGAIFPFWSPDSRFVGFFAGGKLKRVDVSGGPPLTLADAPTGRGGSWSKEGVIVFAPTNRAALQSVRASGGATEPVTVLEGPADRTSHRYPWFLPDGRHFLYVSGVGWPNKLHLASVESKQDKVLSPVGSHVVYSQGHLLFLREDTLMAQPFDARRLATMGEAVPVVQHVAGADTMFHGTFSVSENGALVYQHTASGSRTLAWFGRSGKRLSTVGEPADMIQLRLSPDQQSAAVTALNRGTGSSDIWIYDLARGVPSLFTSGGGSPVWSPDGRAIAYNALGVYQKSLGGLGTAQLLYRHGDIDGIFNWLPDGFLMSRTQNFWLLPLAPERAGGERKPIPILLPTSAVLHGRASPDGRWIAYVSDETQRFEVYASPFPGPGPKLQISLAGGFQPRWRGDGKEIFFIAPDNKLMAAEVAHRGNTLESGAVRSLFSLPAARNPNTVFSTYDVSADGQRVLTIVPAEQSTTPPQPLTVVLNWTASLRK